MGRLQMKPHWTAVAIDHWVTNLNGQPISLKKWPDGWVLAQRNNHRHPAILFRSLRTAVEYLQ